MKRWIHAATDNFLYTFEKGDPVTVYESTVGYANYEGTFVEYTTNSYGVPQAIIDTGHKRKSVYPGNVVPSQYEYFKSLTRDDVLTIDFIKEMIHPNDSMWCKKISFSRVDRDQGMENITGVDAYIEARKPGQQIYRVNIREYVSKHYQEDQDVRDEYNVKPDDEIMQEALDILKKAPEVVVNFAGHQRKF